MNNYSYPIIQSRKSIAHRNIKQYQQTSIDVNEFVNSENNNVASFILSQTLPNLTQYAVTVNVHLLILDHLIRKQYSTQRYQKVSANQPCCKQIYECLFVIAAFNVATFRVTHILPKFMLPITYIQLQIRNAQLLMFDHQI